MSTRGQLRVYLGAAPGVGKTYAMLDEGHRRAARGTDVVVAFVETHGRPQRQSNWTVSSRSPPHGRLPRCEFTEMDLPAVLRARARRSPWSTSWPTPTCPALEHDKRWQDVEQLLEAGIDVISTVNVQHLESLNDVVEAITGVPQRETVPDSVVRAAEQVELVDMTPEALRRRMAHGNIYAPDKVDAALSQLLPTRQPHRAARAGAAVAGRQRRRGAAALPRTARHRRDLGDTRTRRRRPDRRPRGRDADPARTPHRGPRHRRRPARRARRAKRRAGRLEHRRARAATAAGRVARRQLPLGRRRRRARRPCSTSPGPTTRPRSSSAPAGASRVLGRLTGPGTGTTITRRVRFDRRARRQPRLRRQGPGAAPTEPRAHREAAADRAARRRGAAGDPRR